MKKMPKTIVWSTVLGALLYAVYAYAATVNLGRSVITWPDFGDPAGPAQVQTIHDGIQALSDNANSRFEAFSAIADSTTSTHTHNFGVAFSELTVLIYTGTHPSLTRVADPAAAGWTIAAGTSPLTQVDVTTPASGGPHTFAVVVIQGSAVEVIDDLDDVDVTTAPPEDNQALVFDQGSSTWIPGSSGDSSFKCQSVSDPTLSLKSGSLILDSGEELFLPSDLALDLDTVLGSNPSDATTYYLYADLDNIPQAATLANGRKVRTIGTASEFALQTTTPDQISQSRYVPLCFVRSADTGTVWSGTGSDFGTLAFRRHGRPIVNVSPTVYELSKQSVGTVGSIENVQQALSANDFLGAAADSSFWELIDLIDDSGNGRNFTNNGSTPFTALGFRGNSVSNLDGIDDWLTASNTYFDGGKDFSLGMWFKKLDPNQSSHVLWSLGPQDANDRVMQLLLESSNNFRFLATNTATVWDHDIDFNLGPLTIGRWTHVAVTYDHSATLIKMYVDGKKIREFTGAIRGATSPGNLTLGTNLGASAFMKVQFQDVFYTSNFMSDAQINAVYSRRYKGEQMEAGHTLDVNSFEKSGLSVSFYNLEADSNDDSGNGRNLTNNGVVTFDGQGLVGSDFAARFNGSNQFLSSTDSFFNPASNQSFYFAAWVKPEGTAGYGLMYTWTSLSDRQMAIDIQAGSGGRFDCAAHTSAEASGAAATFNRYTAEKMQVGRWYHIAMGWDGTNFKCYFNGEKVHEAPLSDINSISIGARFAIGTDFTDASDLAGEVREMVFAQEPVSDGQIRKLYSKRLDHTASVLDEKQQWYGTFFKEDNGVVSNELDQDWLLDKKQNSVYLSTGLQAGDSLSLRLQNQSLASTVVPIKTFTTGKVSTAPSFPLSHSLGCRPKDFYILHEGASLTGDDDKRYDLCSADNTAIICDLSSLTIDASHRVEVVASCAPLAAAIDIATDSQMLIQQNKSSSDVFVGIGQSYYKPNVEIQTGHTYLVDGIWNTVGPLTGLGTIQGIGTVKALDAGQNGDNFGDLTVDNLQVKGTITGGSPVKIQVGDGTNDGLVLQSLDTGGDDQLIEFRRNNTVGGGNILVNNGNGDTMIRATGSNQQLAVGSKAVSASTTDSGLMINHAGSTDHIGRIVLGNTDDTAGSSFEMMYQNQSGGQTALCNRFNGGGTSNKIVIGFGDATLGECASEVLKVTQNGNTELTPRTDGQGGIGKLYSGIHTPAYTISSGCSSTTPYSTTFMRVGDTVTWSGRFDCNGAVSGTNVVVRATLPIASAFTNAQTDGAGTLTCSNAGQFDAGYVQPDIANDEASFNYEPTETTNQPCWFHFTYRFKL